MFAASPIRPGRLEIDHPTKDDLAAGELTQLRKLIASSGSLSSQVTDATLTMPSLHYETPHHATTGTRLTRDETGRMNLQISTSFPAEMRVQISALIAWLGNILALVPGDVPGYLVPDGSSRHHLRLLVWTGTHLIPLPPIPDRRHEIALPSVEGPRCSQEAFRRATYLPSPDSPKPTLIAATRDVALSLATSKAVPISQAELDGRLVGGVRTALLEWLAGTLSQIRGFNTEAPPAPY